MEVDIICQRCKANFDLDFLNHFDVNGPEVGYFNYRERTWACWACNHEGNLCFSEMCCQKCYICGYVRDRACLLGWDKWRVDKGRFREGYDKIDWN